MPVRGRPPGLPKRSYGALQVKPTRGLTHFSTSKRQNETGVDFLVPGKAGRLGIVER